MSTFNIETIRLGLNNVRLHKLRSALTALGIIFGVAAVICMLSISEGASADEMRLINLLGTRNIIVTSVKPETETRTSEETTFMNEYGITQADITLIEQTIPHIRRVTPLKAVAHAVQHRDKRFERRVVGTTPMFFKTVNVTVSEGRVLTDMDMEDLKQVCVIGDQVRQDLFSYEEAVGKSIYAQSYSGLVPYKVIGVLGAILTAGAPERGVHERDLNRDVFIPLTTARSIYPEISRKLSSGSQETVKVEYSGLYISVDDIDHVLSVSEMVTRVFEHNHEKEDYDVRVPLARLKLAQKKKANQQIVLGMIAGISLLVGGIGIMNIMLASVTERTREIGIRRALGATQRHITVQFLVETVVLSTGGGLVGVVLGCVAAYAVNRLASWETIVQPWTVIVSFTLSALVGIFFGMYPAMTAARLDPIEALRHE